MRNAGVQTDRQKRLRVLLEAILVAAILRFVPVCNCQLVGVSDVCFSLTQKGKDRAGEVVRDSTHLKRAAATCSRVSWLIGERQHIPRCGMWLITPELSCHKPSSSSPLYLSPALFAIPTLLQSLVFFSFFSFFAFIFLLLRFVIEPGAQSRKVSEPGILCNGSRERKADKAEKRQ